MQGQEGKESPLVVCKPQLVASLPGIDDPFLVQIEQVGVVIAVIDLAPPISLSLVDQLASIFSQQLPLLRRFLHQYSGHLEQRVDAECAAG